MSFPDNLKQIRKSKQLSQEALAEMLDVSRQSVSKWELGICMPEAQLLLQLSEVLGVSLDTLMAGSPEDMQTVASESPKKHTGIRILGGCVLLLCILAVLSVKSRTNEEPEPPVSTPVVSVTEDASPVFTTEQDREELYRLGVDFASAYFAQDVDAIASFLSTDFTGDPKEVSPWEGVDAFTVKGVDAISTERDNGVKIISVEFRSPDYPDSFVYLTVQFEKQADEWKIQSYYLEG